MIPVLGLKPFSRRTSWCVALLSLGVILTTIFAPGRAHGYALTGKSWPSGSNIVLQMGLGNAPRILLDGNTSWNVAAASASDAWNAKMDRIKFSRVMNSTAPASSGDRVNSVVFSSSVYGQSFGSGTLAVTYYLMQNTSLIEADVLFNKAAVFDSYRGGLKFGATGIAIADIRRVFLHELGHGLGLNHSGTNTVMNPSISDLDVLAADDIAGVQAMYGAPAAPTPTPTPKPSPTPTPAPIIAKSSKGEFNVDGFGDLTWQNRLTGARSIWLLRNGAFQRVINLASVATEWKIGSAADFNGDGHSDLVWQNSRTGAHAIWFLRNGVHQSSVSLQTLSTAWQIAAAGDFNADGQADLAWQNVLTGQRSIWFLRNGVFQSSISLATTAVEWKIAAAGDFNADGYADLAWQNTRTGARAIWFLRNGVMQRSTSMPTVAIQWSIAGAADFNGDGHADLVSQNTTGSRSISFLRNGAQQSTTALPFVTSDWDIAVH